MVFQALTIKGSLVASIIQIRDLIDLVDKFGIRSHVNTMPLEKVPDLLELYMDPHRKGTSHHEENFLRDKIPWSITLNVHALVVQIVYPSETACLNYTGFSQTTPMNVPYSKN